MAPHRIDTHHHPYTPVYIAKDRRGAQAHHPCLLRPADQMAPGPGHRGDGQERHRRVGAVDLDAERLARRRRRRPATFARECNEAAAEMQRDYKGRFGHFAALPLPDTEGCLREIEYCVRRAPAPTASRSPPTTSTSIPATTRSRRCSTSSNRRKAVVYFHPTAASFAFNVIPNIPPPTIEFPFDTTRAITSLLFGGTFHRCPNIKWIFSHGGGALPMLASRLAGLAKNRPELNARVPNGVMHELSQALCRRRRRHHARRAARGARHRADVASAVRLGLPVLGRRTPPSRGLRG